MSRFAFPSFPFLSPQYTFFQNFTLRSSMGLYMFARRIAVLSRLRRVQSNCFQDLELRETRNQAECLSPHILFAPDERRALWCDLAWRTIRFQVAGLA